MDERFRKLEDEYFRLKGKFTAGRITRAEFITAMKELMVEDAEGRYWTLGVDSGKWFRHNGEAWIEGDPSGVTVGSPDINETRPSEQPVLGGRFPSIAIGGALVMILVGVLLLGGLVFALSRNEIQSRLASTTTPVAVAPTAAPTDVKTTLSTGSATATALSPVSSPSATLSPTLGGPELGPVVILVFNTPSTTLSPTISRPGLGPITCSTGFDQATQTPTGVRADKVIPFGATRFFVSWPYRAIDPNETYSYYWQYGGQQYFGGLHKFPKPSGVGWAMAEDTKPLAAQRYRFEIRIGTKVIAAEECIIK